MESSYPHIKGVLKAALLIGLGVTSIGFAPPVSVSAAPAPEPVQPRPLADRIEPSISLNVPGQVLLGNNVDFTVTFDNSVTNDPSSEPGYGPFIDLIIPTHGTDGVYPGTVNPYDGLGLSTITASYLGVPFTTSGSGQNMWILQFDNTGLVTHPLLRDNTGAYQTVSGTPGDKLVVLKLPFGSFTYNQPPIVVNMGVDMSNLADVGTPLTIRARGGYQFGYTALDDFCCGDNPVNSMTAFTSGSVTPELWTLAKTYSGPEDEAASGPNFRSFYPMRYTVTATIAPGQSITGLTLTDTLPDNLQYHALISTSPAASCTEPSTTTPGGTLTCTFSGSVSGTATMTFDFYIPLEDASSNPVIDPATGTVVISCNNAGASANWTPVDTRDASSPITQDPAGCEHTLNDRSIAMQKSSTLVGGGAIAPLKVVEYTLNFQVSDFFAFDNVQLTDVLSDGQRLDTSFTPRLSIQGNTDNLSSVTMNAANYDVNCYYTTSKTTVTGTPPGTECDTNPGPNSSIPEQYGTTQIVFKISDELVTNGDSSMLFGGCVNPDPTSGDPLNCDPGNGGYNDGPTYGSIVFRAIVQEKFSDNFPSGDDSVDEGDILTNEGHYVQGDVLNIVSNAWSNTHNQPQDGSSTDRTIATGKLKKSIYALDGETNSSLWPTDTSGRVKITPGDELTYRIEYDLPTSDEENMDFKDYLPKPIFDVDDPTQSGTGGWTWIFDTPAGSPPTATIDGSVPASGHGKFGPDDTFYNYSGQATSTPGTPMLPALTDDPANNMLDFFYGDFNDTRHLTKHVDLLFTVTVSDAPFADDLYLTNEAEGVEGSTNSGEIGASAINQVVLGEPVLVSNKSVVWTSKTTATFSSPIGSGVAFQSPASAPRWTGNINSNYLDAHPIDSNLSGVDAGDIVTFAIVVHNTGSSLDGAFDIQLKDALQAQYQYPNNDVANLNLQVYYGNGTGPIDYTNLTHTCMGSIDGMPCAANLFGTGIELVDPVGKGVCQTHDPNLGNDIILVTYDLQLKSSVAPGDIINTESLINYASRESGPNFLAQPQTDTATTTVSTTMTKTLVGTEFVSGNNTNTRAVIGELVTYQVDIIPPEGTVPAAQVVDTLDTGLAFVDIQSVTYSSGVTSTLTPGTGTSPANVTIANSGGGTGNLITINFGTITDANFNTNNPAQSNPLSDRITIVYDAVVLDVAGNQAGTLLNNSARYAWTGGNMTRSANNITVIESNITTTKTVAGSPADAGDTVTYTVTLANPASGTGADAFDITWSDVVPADMTYVTGSLAPLSCGGATTVVETAAPTLTASITQILNGGSCQLTFQATINYTVTPGETVSNTATTQWTSLTGAITNLSNYNVASDERTGAGGLPGPGIIDDYRSQGSVNVLINTVTADKSLIATSEGDTSGANVMIGEIVRYRVPIIVPEGTSPNVQVRDLIPPGMAFLNDGSARIAFVSGDAASCPGAPSMTSTTISGSGLWFCGDESNVGTITPSFTLPSSAITNSSSPGNPFGSGDVPYFDLGTINVNDSDANQEFAVLEYNTIVLNIAANVDGSQLDNQYEVWINGARNNTSSIVSAFVVESDVTLTKTNSVLAATVDAGDTVTYTITIANTGANAHAPAYDSRFLDTLPSGLTLIPGLSPTFSGGASGLTNNNPTAAGNAVDFTITRIPAGGQAVVTYRATVNISVTPQQVIDNTGNLTWTSLPGDHGTTSNATGSSTPGSTGDINGERGGVGGSPNNYLATDTSSIRVADPHFSKTIDSTSEATTSGANMTIGEVATFGLIVTLPEGTTPSLHIVDQLPVGLSYVDSSYRVVTQTHPPAICGSLSADFGGTLPTPTLTLNPPAGGDGATVTFDFTSITTNGDNNTNNNSFLICFQAVLLNEASNQAGTDLTNNANIEIGTTPPFTASDSQVVHIVEPVLTITKTASDLQPAPNEVVTFTLTISHDVTSTAEAFDLVVNDPLPAGLVPDLASVSVTGSGGATGATNTSSGTTISATATTFPIGASLTITFHATVVNGYSSTIVNTGTLTWTSLPNLDLNERTGAGTGSNDYSASGSVTLTELRNLAKNLIANTYGGGPPVPLVSRIGDILTYQVDVTVPPLSTDTAIVVDNLPAGLAFVDCQDITAGPTLPTPLVSSRMTFNTAGNCNHGTDAAVNNPLIENDGNTVTFNFGTLQNTGTASQTITIIYRVVVLDIVSNVDGISLVNNVSWTGGAWGTISAAATPVTVRESALTIQKSVDPQVTSPGSPVVYTINVEHGPNSHADAFDLILTDVLPEGLELAGNNPATAITVSAGSQVPDSINYVFATRTLTVTWNNFLLGAQTELHIAVVLDPDLVHGSKIVNEVTLEWTSLPGIPTGYDAAHPGIQSAYNVFSTKRRYDPRRPADSYVATSSATLVILHAPRTGFAPGRATLLPEQPEDLAYQNLGDMWLEIPKLGVDVSIVGVPLGDDGEWNLTWLGDQAGYLDHTAYPTHAGNSVITGHVYMADGKPGPFVNLHTLGWGDQIIVHLDGQSYIYQVREEKVISPDDISVFKHESMPWLTLITCKDYDAATDSYRHHVAVRAVLVGIQTDPAPIPNSGR